MLLSLGLLEHHPDMAAGLSQCKRSPKEQGEAIMFFIMQPQKSPSAIPIIFYWSHRLAPVTVGGEDSEKGRLNRDHLGDWL